MMDDDTKKLVAAVGVAAATGVVVSGLTFYLGDRKETRRLHAEYVTKWKKLGPVISLFEQLGEWLDDFHPETTDSDEFMKGFLERAEYLGIACRALSDDDLPEKEK